MKHLLVYHGFSPLALYNQNIIILNPKKWEQVGLAVYWKN